jgi:hypothetical protein
MTTPAAHVKDPAFRGRASLPYAVKRVELAVRSQLETLLKPSGITPVQYTALTVLDRHDGVPAAHAAAPGTDANQEKGAVPTATRASTDGRSSGPLERKA